MQRKIYPWLVGGALLACVLGGCGDLGSESTSDFVGGGQTFAGSGITPKGLVVTEPAPIYGEGGQPVDALELEAYDAQGNRLAQEIVDFSDAMNFKALPTGTASIQLDYLRHHGVPMFRYAGNIAAGQSRLENPPEVKVDASSSWKVLPQEDGTFKLEVTAQDGDKKTVNSDYRIKGVCYAPCPINVRGDGAPQINDFFFDNLYFDPDKGEVNGNIKFFNWYGLWGNGSLGHDDQLNVDYYAREDLNKIRDLGANTIRVYGIGSRQQNVPKPFASPTPIPAYPDPQSQYHLQHKQFLAKCWNAGEKPLYVIVGISLPADCVYKSLDGSQAQKFWDFVIRETIADLKDEPAVLGFTIINEINDGNQAFPGTGPGGQMKADDTSTGLTNANSDFYWAKIKEYSDYGKATAPSKLMGQAYHDFREIAQYSAAFPKSGPTYLEQCKNLDFVGVNTYQVTNYDDQFKKGWGSVPVAMRKPIIFTELGFPATTRDGDDPLTIKDTAESRTNTGNFLKGILPKAYADRVCLGVCYFEYSDEWWKQNEDTGQFYNPDTRQTETVRRVDRQYGGNRQDPFPNHWWDEEGFGLFGVERWTNPKTGEKLPNDAPVIAKTNEGVDIGPDRRLDKVIERKEITKELKAVWAALK